jgi:radical SAM superfamily enzyme YgiQ (UPF0313 family)
LINAVSCNDVVDGMTPLARNVISAKVPAQLAHKRKYVYPSRATFDLYPVLAFRPSLPRRRIETMELSYRRGADVFVPAGSYRQREAALRDHSAELSEIPAVVLSCFDPSTRMLPFIIYDRFLFPAGARTVAGALFQAGFLRTRAVFGLWNPNFRPSQAKIDGRLPQMLLLSSMHLHEVAVRDAIRDAWSMGKDRPLIIAGGPQAHYEPYGYWSIETPKGLVGPDVVCTGEAYVLLDLCHTLLGFHRSGEHIRQAFERARRQGALNGVPGLVYVDSGTDLNHPKLVDTGLQRLVQHLDEMPHEVSGLSILEPPHRGRGLSPAPLTDKQVRYRARICSLLVTQGCKFNCSYCPIPAVNQKTWRFRSPEGLVHEFRSVRERFGIKHYFGTDDNFFNRRQTAEEFFEAIAKARTARGKILGHHVYWGTEATQHDTYKNRDLLPLARKAGLRAIWFGIEDLTAELINKGQKPEITAELFPLMHQHKIMPMAMMMFHEGQPFYTKHSLYGIANQIDFLRQAGAVSLQLTIHCPALGTREWERTFATGAVLKRLGNYDIRGARYYDGNHVLVAGQTPAWLKQVQLLGGYFRFYNPRNFWRALRDTASPLRRHRLAFQLLGLVAAIRTAWKLLPYAGLLLTRKPTFHTSHPPDTQVPVGLATGGFSRTPDAAQNKAA